jgi:purine-binding chemotaxis protein CheW
MKIRMIGKFYFERGILMKKKILSFYINSNLFGVDIRIVKEINRNVNFTDVPDSEKMIIGLFNMRGHVVTLFNIHQFLEGDSKKVGGKNNCIILKSFEDDTNHTGFFVDKLGSVLDIEDEYLEPSPSNMSNIEAQCIEGIAKLETELLIVIQPERMFSEKFYSKG